jgi:hypothetical protein
MIETFSRWNWISVLAGLVALPTLYVVGFVSTIPEPLQQLILIDAPITLVSEFLLKLALVVFSVRLFLLMLRFLLASVSRVRFESLKKLGLWSRFVSRAVRRNEIWFFWPIFFVAIAVTLVGSTFAEGLIGTGILFGAFVFFVSAVVHLNRFSILPRDRHVFSKSRVARSLGVSFALTSLGVSYIAGQYKFLQSASSCTQFITSVNATLAAPVWYSGNGVIVVDNFRMTSFNPLKKVEYVSARFVPYEEIREIEAETRTLELGVLLYGSPPSTVFSCAEQPTR